MQFSIFVYDVIFLCCILKIFYQFTSFLTPGIIYHCNLIDENSSPKVIPFFSTQSSFYASCINTLYLIAHEIYQQVFHETVVEGFDACLYETVQVFFSSKDGTKIPMFIVHRKVRNIYDHK